MRNSAFIGARLVLTVLLSCAVLSGAVAGAQSPRPGAQAPPAPAIQPAGEAMIEVEIASGKPEITARGITLTPAQEDALRGAFSRRLRDTPFQSAGGLNLKIKGRQAENLLRRLNQADLNDPQQVDRAVATAWREFRDDAWSLEEGAGDRERVYIGQSFTIGRDETVDNVVSIGGSGTILGKVDQLVLIGSTVGPVSGDVNNLVMLGSRGALAPEGHVRQTMTLLGSRFDLAPGAKVEAQEVQVVLPTRWDWVGSAPFAWTSPERTWGARAVSAAVSYIVTLAFGWLILALFPGFFREALGFLRGHKLSSFGIGLGGYFLVLPGALLLVLTLIGILFLPLYFMGFGALVFTGYLVTAAFIGHLLPLRRELNEVAALAAGLAVVKLVGLAPLAGSFLAFLLATIGFGAVLRVLLVRFKNRRLPRAGSAAAPGGVPSRPAPVV